jgi:hypothetical protein
MKKAILHRKNSMFYKTRNGARIGDMYMSLIYTCELSGANACALGMIERLKVKVLYGAYRRQP